MIRIRKSSLNGTVEIPSSKSVAHRHLIAAALCKNKTVICGRMYGDDIDATIACLNALGANIRRQDEAHIEVTPICQDSVAGKRCVIDANASGSTLRFLLPLSAALGSCATFVGCKRLSERPIGELVNALRKHGAKVDAESLPIEIDGKLSGGVYEIAADVSSQYVTGLLFALPILSEDSKIFLMGEQVSTAYIDITIQLLSEYSIKIDKTDYGYFIRGGQQYISPEMVKVEGDWSNAGFFIVGGCLCGNVTLTGLNLSSAQGDRVIVDVLNEAGAIIKLQENKISVNKTRLHAVNFNAENTPDIVPILAVALATAEGTSVISGISRLRIKESDRVSETVRLLRSFGADVSANEDRLTIKGGVLNSAALSLPDDHRMAMSAAIAAVCADGESVLIGTKCVSKSYPDFFNDLISIGGDCDV